MGLIIEDEIYILIDFRLEFGPRSSIYPTLHRVERGID